MFWAKWLVIVAVECVTQFGACSEDLAARTKFLIGRPIYWPLPRPEIANTFSELVDVSQVVVYRRLPRTVVVEVTLRRPVAVVLGPSGKRVVVDEEGVVFDNRDKSTLPTLALDFEAKVGSRLAPIQLEAVRRLSQIAAIVGQPISGALDESQLVVTVAAGSQIILGVSSPPTNWAASLQAIWARSKIDGKFMRQIDLRFDPAVVSD